MLSSQIAVKILLLLCFAYSTHIATAAQNVKNDLTDGSESGEHMHDNHQNEIGLSCSPVFFVNESTWSYGMHLHYIHMFQGTKFGIGAGIERIFDEHGHNTFGLIACYRPIDNLSLMFSPGAVVESANPDELEFAWHAEASYEFAINDFHIGPALDFAYAAEDLHLSLGLHVGYGF